MNLAHRLRHDPEVPILGALLALAVIVPPLAGQPAGAGVYAQGVVGGAALALEAVAVVLVYRTHRIINFAQLQLGALSGILFLGLVQYRVFIRLLQGVCAGCLGGSADAAPTWALAINLLISLVLCVGLSMVLGFLVYILIIRFFKRSPPLLLTVATIAVGQLLVGLAGQVPGLLFGSLVGSGGQLNGATTSPVDVVIHISPVNLHLPDLLILVSALAVCASLGVFLKRTRMGILLRGSGDNAERAETLGVNTDSLAAAVWTLAGFLSGLVLTLSQLSSAGISANGSAAELTTMVGILAAVVMARLSRLWLTVAAAVVLGVVQQVVLWVTHTAAIYELLTLALITAFLLVQRARSSRSELQAEAGWRVAREVRPVPRELRGLAPVRNYRYTFIGLAVLLALLFPWLVDSSYANFGTQALIYALVGLSLLVLTGWAGQISLGQWGLAAVGAYMAALVTGSWGLPFPLALLAGAAAGSAAALLLGLPALRLRGLHLAVTTLAFGVTVTGLLLNQSYLGRYLPSSLPRPSLLGVGSDDERVFYYMALVMLTVAVLATLGLRRSRIGRALIASRDNEQAAQLFGLNLTKLRLLAFGVSGFYAGWAGALFAFHQYGAQADAFDPQTSLTIFLITVFGGLGAVSGPLLGAAVYELIILSGVTGLGTSGVGIVVLLMLLFFPGGLSGVVTSIRDAGLRRIAKRYRVLVPSLLADRAPGEEERLALAPLTHRGTGVFVPERYELSGQWGLPASATSAEHGG